MAKKKKHPEHVNNERWLVSYADFITLLFAFFVVLFSSSQVESSKSNKLSLAVQAAFSSFSVFKERAGKLDILGSSDGNAEGGSETMGKGRNILVSKVDLPPKKGKEADVLLPAYIEHVEEGFYVQGGNPDYNVNVGFLSSDEQALARAQRDILQLMDEKKYSGSSLVSLNDQGVMLTLNDAGLFESGSDELSENSKEMLTGLAKVIKLLPNQIRIEGHTDDALPPANFKSKWDFSAARAARVEEWLIEAHGVAPDRFAVMGYADTRSVNDNADNVARQRNNRVDILLMTEKAATQEGMQHNERVNIPVPKEMTENQDAQVHEVDAVLGGPIDLSESLPSSAAPVE